MLSQEMLRVWHKNVFLGNAFYWILPHIIYIDETCVKDWIVVATIREYSNIDWFKTRLSLWELCIMEKVCCWWSNDHATK